jgi:3-dehydroquinate dehydratase-1
VELKRRDAMRVVKVKDVVFGEGRPKVLIPITAKSVSHAADVARRLGMESRIDAIEFRVDYLDTALDAAAVARATLDVARAAANKPVIVTFRTKAEGGIAAVNDEAYANIYQEILTHGHADLIDVELMRDRGVVNRLVDAAHKVNTVVLMSNHHFDGTPPESELIGHLRLMQELGADILKIATMPKDAGDVLTLLAATWTMYSTYADRPLITMAMGGAGAISRLSGELFGSSATFGMVGDGSAPGQLALSDLRMVLDVIHSASGTQ